MTHVQQGNLVKVHYTGRLEDGTEFDTSAGIEPMEFTIGSSEVIPGFEQAVLGMVPGETKTVTLAAEDAYGPHLEEMIAVVERKDIPDDVELILGHQLEVTQDDGSSFVVMVTELTEESVTLDANHPLAGKNLVFDLNLVEIV
ncbi:FKBP-type peptidyl-prolyl cis-trans isomerase 2 [Desulfuromonas soudanensis]|uniref:Peptidyl-prolyl cis-trans isomerase n=1 Tax=Desulfuromonas soudanensis TaxID=1603606 RepID=A0A0M4DJZ1_9BACT|nr:peptidylprolyl isomerase [Desulfuromonas soudanensis]ALC17787.1 FKBP-type peptidyl-prolyl cis-trans isomerase 2 [Desulfuromonas soudanensis]